MKEETLKYFAKKGFLLNPEIADLFIIINDRAISEEILKR